MRSTDDYKFFRTNSYFNLVTGAPNFFLILGLVLAFPFLDVFNIVTGQDVLDTANSYNRVDVESGETASLPTERTSLFQKSTKPPPTSSTTSQSVRVLDNATEAPALARVASPPRVKVDTPGPFTAMYNSRIEK